MIKAHKYLNLDLSVINVSALIIKGLKQNETVQYDELLQFVVNALGTSAKEVYPYAINFLYVLGKIQYIEAPIDAFVLNTKMPVNV
jgi:hypothetical protein